MTNLSSPCAASIVLPQRATPLQRIESAAVALWRQLQCWFERARQRRELARLTDGQLADIGVAREDALAEAAKPFWRP